MRFIQFWKYNLFFQPIFWALWFFIFYVTGIGGDFTTRPILYAFIRTFSLAFVIYVNYLLLLPYLFEERKYIGYGVSILALLVTVFYINYHLSPYVEPKRTPNIELFFVFFIFNSIMIILTSLFRYVDKWFKQVEIQANLKNEKLKAELNFLKAQINPHFLFNTLNNIYTLAYMKADNAPIMIEKLSDIMRYMLYDCRAEKVSLYKEVSLFENFIALQQLKKEEKQNIYFDYRGVKSDHLIAPLILINFLENAFKHADLENNKKAFVKILLVVDEMDNLKMTICNTMKEKSRKKMDNGGIGLDNSRKQLEHNYANAYSMEIQPDGNLFKLRLNIALERKL